jgi:starch phosphorylase
MVRQYTTDLYLPATRSSRALVGGEGDGAFPGAAELAAWKQRVERAWPDVKIELVETDDGEQSPGAKLAVRAGVALGDLDPGDVCVEVIYGRAGADDEIIDPVHAELELEQQPGADSVAWYCGEALLGQPGPFGYTVRVLPRHQLLAAPAELGLVRLPVAPTGLVSGDLR